MTDFKNDCSGMIPILRSFNEEATKAFYINFLEFELTFEHRLEPNTPLYMGLKKGDCVIHISEHYGDAAPGASVRFEVSDVHGFSKHLNDKKYKYARPGVQSQPWGYDEMAINDPSGNKIIFCTEHKS